MRFHPEEFRTRLADSGSIYDVGFDATFAAEKWHSIAVDATDPGTTEVNQFAAVEDTAMQQVVLYRATTGAFRAVNPEWQKFQAELRSVMNGELASDAGPAARIVAAEALGKFGSESDLSASLDLLIDYADVEKHGVYTAQAALIALDELDTLRLLRDRIAMLPRTAPGIHARMNSYIPRLIEKTLEGLAAVR